MTMVKLDRERELRFTVAAARKFKGAYGIPLWKTVLTNPLDGTMELMDSHCLTHVIWAGLLHDSPKLRIAQAEDILQKYVNDGGLVADLYDSFAEAFKECGFFPNTSDPYKDEVEEGLEEIKKETDKGDDPN